MKVICIECDAEEMRANRTIMDSLTEAFGSITRAVAGIDCTPEMIANAMAENEETETKESIKEDICDNYCKFPDTNSDLELEEICENCPLNNM